MNIFLGKSCRVGRRGSSRRTDGRGLSLQATARCRGLDQADTLSHSRPSGGWNHVDHSTGFPKKNVHAMPPRVPVEATLAAAQLIHSVVSKNSTLNVGNCPISPINERLYHPHGPSRIRFRRSDRSRTHSEERFGGSGGYRDNSDKNK